MKAIRYQHSYVALFERAQQVQEQVCREYHHEGICKKIRRIKKNQLHNRSES